MRNIKQFFRLYYLALLRFRLHYATGAVCRVSGYFRAAYHAALSQAFWKLSLWDNAYQEQKRQYLAAKEAELYESKH